MNIIEKHVAELKEYENNPRDNERAVEPVAASIKEFGFKVPIIIDADGVIVAGHTRKKAAERLGLEKVPCIIADDLTPEQIKAFRLADNKTGEFAKWDFESLEKELSELSARDFDMQEFGFFQVHIDDLESIFEQTESDEPAEPSHREEASEEADGESDSVFVLRLEFSDEEDAADLIEFLKSEDYEYSFERR